MAPTASSSSTTADPSEFAVALAVGYAHVLDTVLGFLDRASSPARTIISPVLAVSLALPVLLAYLVAAALAFAARVAADSYAHLRNVRSGEPAAGIVWQAVVALVPVAAVVKRTVRLAVFSAIGGLAVALLRFCSEPCSLGLTANGWDM